MPNVISPQGPSVLGDTSAPHVRVTVPSQAFLGYEEAAAFCGDISPDLLSRSDCPRCAIGGRVVFFVVDLVQYVLARRSPPLDATASIEIQLVPRLTERAA